MGATVFFYPDAWAEVAGMVGAGEGGGWSLVLTREVVCLPGFLPTAAQLQPLMLGSPLPHRPRTAPNHHPTLWQVRERAAALGGRLKLGLGINNSK